MYAPLDGSVAGTTFLFTWEPVCKHALRLIEGAVYRPSNHEEAIFRQAVKNGNSLEEILAFREYSETVAEIGWQPVILNGAAEPPPGPTETTPALLIGLSRIYKK